MNSVSVHEKSIKNSSCQFMNIVHELFIISLFMNFDEQMMNYSTSSSNSWKQQGSWTFVFMNWWWTLELVQELVQSAKASSCHFINISWTVDELFKVDELFMNYWSWWTVHELFIKVHEVFINVHELLKLMNCSWTFQVDELFMNYSSWWTVHELFKDDELLMDNQVMLKLYSDWSLN